MHSAHLFRIKCIVIKWLPPFQNIVGCSGQFMGNNGKGFSPAIFIDQFLMVLFGKITVSDEEAGSLRKSPFQIGIADFIVFCPFSFPMILWDTLRVCNRMQNSALWEIVQYPVFRREWSILISARLREWSLTMNMRQNHGT